MRTLAMASVAALLTLSVGCRRTGPGEDTGDTDTDTDSDTDTDTDSDTTSFDCDEGPPDTDWWGTIPADLATTTPPEVDAGIGALLAAAPAPGEYADFETPIVIDHAVVSHAEYAPEGAVARNIWLQDKSGAIRTYHNFNDNENPRIKIPQDIAGGLPPGSVVSFTVSSMTNYYGELEILDLDNFVKHEETSLVYVVDATDGTELTFDENRAEVARIWAEIAEVREPCGSYSCYTVETHGHEYVLRIKKSYFQGDCIPIAAPVAQFSDEVQFNISDFDAVGDPF